MGTHRIAAAAVNNPVVDWIFPSDLHQEAESENASDDLDVSTVSTDDDGRIALQNKLKKNPDAHISSWDKYGGNPALPLSAVVHARASLFPNADAYFDRFACPIHFFRTPGIGYVVPTKTEDDLASEVPRELDTIENPEPVLETLKPIIEKRRRSHRLYPPTGMGLRLPVMSIIVGEESVLRDQSEELVRLIKRSVIRDTRNEDEAERRAGLTLRPGAGLWSGHSRASNWHEEIGAIGEWFGRVLA
ncbi:hypothetical protein SLS56_008902 [Neofusicoccum ribis]|uniref:Uncharacterized protein n=1 Tax=Neofusicoccum ribis TaxID=45134 RepID=A0ABR3SIR4_9PEZI